MERKFCGACGVEYLEGMKIPLDKDGTIYCPIEKRKAIIRMVKD